MSVLSRQKNESSSREEPQLDSGLCINNSGLSGAPVTPDRLDLDVGNNISSTSFYSDLICVFFHVSTSSSINRAAFALMLGCTALAEQEDRAAMKHQCE